MATVTIKFKNSNHFYHLSSFSNQRVFSVRILHLPRWRSVGFKRPSVQNGAKMGIKREEIKNLLKEAIEPSERKLDNLNNSILKLLLWK